MSDDLGAGSAERLAAHGESHSLRPAGRITSRQLVLRDLLAVLKILRRSDAETCGVSVWCGVAIRHDVRRHPLCGHKFSGNDCSDREPPTNTQATKPGRPRLICE